MSMRSQIYEWNGLGPNADTSKNFVAGQAGRAVSIFIGGFGNNITKPAETTATEFVVIEDIACTPTLPATATAATVSTDYRGQLGDFTPGNGTLGPRAYVQVRINTTDYFLTQTMLQTKVSQVRPVLTLGPLISSLPSTYTLMYMCCQDKFGTSFTLLSTQVLGEQQAE